MVLSIRSYACVRSASCISNTSFIHTDWRVISQENVFRSFGALHIRISSEFDWIGGVITHIPIILDADRLLLSSESNRWENHDKNETEYFKSEGQTFSLNKMVAIEAVVCICTLCEHKYVYACSFAKRL